MKKLYLIRHAKSSWSNPGLSDFERPLNKRGLKDADRMGKVLKRILPHPDCVLTSSARRAQETAEILADKIGFPIKKVIVEERIYGAAVHDLLEIITELDDKLKTVVLFGHNPGMTNLANLLNDIETDNIPTCGIFVIEFQTKHWRKIAEKTGTFLAFEYPKKYK
jgi:phosphohistidine phosphatase